MKKLIEKTMDRFIVASTAETIDSKLIYWHSCLDILKNNLNGCGKSFTHQLLDACKKSGIPWNDLFPELTDSSVDNGMDFPLNKIRNDMLHHGIYPDDYPQAYIAMQKTQALCERLILKWLGLDYINSGLGIIRN